MSTHTAPPDTDSVETDEAADTTPSKRFRPHHLAIGLGIGIAVFTAVSGIVPQITDWHNENDVHRVVFGNVPGPLQVAVLHVDPGGAGVGRVPLRRSDEELGTRRSGPTRRTTPKNAKRRLADFRAGVYMRTLLRDPAAGLMHSMIYFGFLVLLGVTTVLEVDHQLPEDLKFLHGRTYQAYAFVGDAAGVVFVGGIVWAIVRRYVQRPYRIRIKTKAEHALDPRHVPRHRAQRVRRRDVPHRPRRHGPTTRSGASSATR